MRGVAALGGDIVAHFDDIGYFRARLPLTQFGKAKSVPGVLMALIDGATNSFGSVQPLVTYPEPRKSKADSLKADSARKDSLAADSIRVAALPLIPDAARGAETPFVSMNDMRAYDLRRMDPRFDGRGATVAVLEGGTFDFLTPALQNAKALDGHTIQKLAGVITSFAFDADISQPELLVGGSGYADFDKERVRRTKTVTATGGTFVVDTTTFHAPDGTYSFGWYKRGKAAHAVIWDEGKKTAWIDANGDKSFTDEKAMADINVAFDVGTMKSLDSTAKDPLRSVRFAISFDSIPGMLRIFEGTAGHQTMVAGVAAGSGILGGPDAGASGARVMIVDAGRHIYSFLEAWIRAAQDPRVDVVTSSASGEAFISAGEGLLALVMNRLIEVYDKPFFASAHNQGPGTTSAGDPSTIPRVMSIGGYASASTYKAHYGWDLPDKDYLVSYASRGPAANGGAKPDVVGTILSVSAAPCLGLKPAHTPIYRFPDCYQLGGGTSSSSPHSAGMATLLISAARQSGLPSDSRHITWAMKMGARFLTNYPAHEQGAGLIDVVHSYELLKLAKEKNIDIPDIETRGPVHTRLSKFLREPGWGDGLYERDGWKVADVRVRTIKLTRRTGPSGPVTYALGWRGNDGTFSATDKSVTLPLDVPTSVNVRIAPKTSGMHSAHLLLIDTKAGVPIHHVLNTVVAADQFTPANGFAVKYAERLPWPRAKSFFIDIPDGTASLRFDLAVKSGRVKLSTSDATLDNMYRVAREQRHPYKYAAKGLNEFVYAGHRGTHVVADPEPGVMGVLIEPLGSPAAWDDSSKYNVTSDYELKVSIQSARGDLAQAAQVGRTVPISFTSIQATLGDARVVAEVGARRILRGVVGGSDGPATFYIIVDSNTATLRVDAVVDDPGSEVMFYLYDCAKPKGEPAGGGRGAGGGGGSTDQCALWDMTHRDGSRQGFLVMKPRPGTWKVVVDATKTGRSPFTYTEIMTHPSFGSAALASPTAERASGGKFAGRATFEAAGTPRIGYSWVGVADLYDEAVERAERDQPIGWFPPHLTPYRPVRLGTVVVPLLGAGPKKVADDDVRR